MSPIEPLRLARIQPQGRPEVTSDMTRRVSRVAAGPAGAEWPTPRRPADTPRGPTAVVARVAARRCLSPGRRARRCRPEGSPHAADDRPRHPARGPSDLRLDRLRRRPSSRASWRSRSGSCSWPIPTGKAIGVPQGWIEATVFGTYLIPGLYLFAGQRHRDARAGRPDGAAPLVVAPWLTGDAGDRTDDLDRWSSSLVMPETMILQWIFLATGLVLGFVALFWLRRTGQLRLW